MDLHEIHAELNINFARLPYVPYTIMPFTLRPHLSCYFYKYLAPYIYS
jgi:hypothetical protein